jgi:hypothetical protein
VSKRRKERERERESDRTYNQLIEKENIGDMIAKPFSSIFNRGACAGAHRTLKL